MKLGVGDRVRTRLSGSMWHEISAIELHWDDKSALFKEVDVLLLFACGVTAPYYYVEEVRSGAAQLPVLADATVAAAERLQAAFRHHEFGCNARASFFDNAGAPIPGRFNGMGEPISESIGECPFILRALDDLIATARASARLAEANDIGGAMRCEEDAEGCRSQVRYWRAEVERLAAQEQTPRGPVNAWSGRA